MKQIIAAWLNRYFANAEALVLLLLISLVAAGLYLLGSIAVPILIALVFAYVLQGVVQRLAQLGAPKWLSVNATFVLFLGAFIGFLVFLFPRIWRQLTRLYQDLPNLALSGQEMAAQWARNYDWLISQKQVQTWIEVLNTEAANIGQWIVTASFTNLPVFMEIVAYTVIVPILVYFMLSDKDRILEYLTSFLPEDRPFLQGIGEEMNKQLENYVRGKFIELTLAGIATYILFSVFDLNYAALLAFLVGLSVIIPYLGIAVITVPVVVIALMQFGFDGSFWSLMAGYILIQALDGMLLVPLLFSEANDIHPLAIIIAVLVFGAWFGVAGVFFAIPLAIFIKAMIEAWPRLGTPSSAEKT